LISTVSVSVSVPLSCFLESREIVEMIHFMLCIQCHHVLITFDLDINWMENQLPLVKDKIATLVEFMENNEELLKKNKQWDQFDSLNTDNIILNLTHIIQALEEKSQLCEEIDNTMQVSEPSLESAQN